MGELRRYLLSMGIEDEALIEEMFKALDVNQDGMLSFSEFAAGALLLFKDMLEERLAEIFQHHDTSKNGQLDEEEAGEFLEDVFAAMDREKHESPTAVLEQLLRDCRSGSQRTVSYRQLRDYILGPDPAVVDT